MSHPLTACQQKLDQWFDLKANKTTIPTELMAGLTTFLTMAYAVIVNPAILAKTGMDAGSVFVATCGVASLGCILTALLANYPVAIGPSMALNVFFAFELVDHLHFSWAQSLGIVACAGALLGILTRFGVREWLEATMPDALKKATSAGIGLFIGVIALKFSGVTNTDKPITAWLHHINTTHLLVFALGSALIFVLNKRRVLGSTLIGILAMTLLGSVLEPLHFQGVFSTPPSIMATFGHWQFDGIFTARGITTICSLLLVSFFDCSATLFGVLADTHHIKAKDMPEKMRRGMYANSLAIIGGALMGTSTANPYFESSTGIASGGRTGLSMLMVAFLFMLCLCFSPLVKFIPAYATSGALLFVAFSMGHRIKEIPWGHWADALPAAVTLVMIPASFSIADGIGYGMGCYLVVQAITGQLKNLNRHVLLLCAIFAAYFALRLMG